MLGTDRFWQWFTRSVLTKVILSELTTLSKHSETKCKQCHLVQKTTLKLKTNPERSFYSLATVNVFGDAEMRTYMNSESLWVYTYTGINTKESLSKRHKESWKMLAHEKSSNYRDDYHDLITN